LTDLKSVLNKAIAWGFLETHPLKTLKQCKVDNRGAFRYLNEKEEKALRTALDEREEELRKERDKGNEWRAIRDYKPMPNLRSIVYADRMKPMILLSIHTGLRRGEVFNLRWQDIDFEKELLTVQGETAKSGTTRHVPLNIEVLRVLKAWHKQSEATPKGYVFPSIDGVSRLNNVTKSWKAILKKSQIEGFRWHDLRHHFASKLVMAGVDLNTVRELLGHSDYKMTLRYAHLAPEHKALAVSKLVAVGE